MKAHVKWIGDEKFLGTSESGHSLVLDANGGQHAPSPLENILISLGGCSSVDVVSILNKAKQDIHECFVEISATRVDETPRVFSEIHLHFVVVGNNVNKKHVERAINLSADKYCSVAQMLNKSVIITHDYKLKEKE